MLNFFRKSQWNVGLLVILITCTATQSLTAFAAEPAGAVTPTGGATDPGGLPGGGGYLQQIADNTSSTLEVINTLPDYLNQVLKLVIAWMTPDSTPTTAKLQSSFSTYANQFLAQTAPDPKIQQQILTDFFGPLVTAETLPTVNDLTYQTLLGLPYLTPDPRSKAKPPIEFNSAFNYIENAAGVHVSHVMPGTNWSGLAEDQIAYGNYYNAVSAVQTYNAYILSKTYADMQNSKSLSEAESSLIKQASSGDWFTQIATEEIGIVLRQILMYNSQMFIVMTQQLDAQKQLLTSQAMANTLLVLSNQSGESFMLTKAKQKLPGSN